MTKRPITQEYPSTAGDGPLRSSKRHRAAYECILCGTSYPEKRSLVRHFDTPAHCAKAGIPPPSHVCSYCDRLFSRKDIRRRHIREIHLGEKRATPRRPADANVVKDIGIAPEPLGVARWVESYDIQDLFADTSLSYPLNEGAFTWEDTLESYLSALLYPERIANEDDMVEGHPRSIGDSTVASSSDQYSLVSRDISHGKSSATSIAGENNPDTHDGMESLEAIESSPSGVFDQPKRAAGVTQAVFSLPGTSTYDPRLLAAVGASKKPSNVRSDGACSLCSLPFGNTSSEIREHLDYHLRELRDEQTHVCRVCEIGFVHKADLQKHIQSATTSHCGFMFEHELPCTGHHPPIPGTDGLSDSDRMQLSNRLRGWEISQLQAYMASIDGAMATQKLARDSERWSITAAVRNSSEMIMNLAGAAGLKQDSDKIDVESLRTTRSEGKAWHSRGIIGGLKKTVVSGVLLTEGVVVMSGLVFYLFAREVISTTVSAANSAIETVTGREQFFDPITDDEGGCC